MATSGVSRHGRRRGAGRGRTVNADRHCDKDITIKTAKNTEADAFICRQLSALIERKRVEQSRDKVEVVCTFAMTGGPCGCVLTLQGVKRDGSIILSGAGIRNFKLHLSSKMHKVEVCEKEGDDGKKTFAFEPVKAEKKSADKRERTVTDADAHDVDAPAADAPGTIRTASDAGSEGGGGEGLQASKRPRVQMRFAGEGMNVASRKECEIATALALADLNVSFSASQRLSWKRMCQAYSLGAYDGPTPKVLSDSIDAVSKMAPVPGVGILYSMAVDNGTRHHVKVTTGVASWADVDFVNHSTVLGLYSFRGMATAGDTGAEDVAHAVSQIKLNSENGVLFSLTGDRGSNNNELEFTLDDLGDQHVSFRRDLECLCHMLQRTTLADVLGNDAAAPRGAIYLNEEVHAAFKALHEFASAVSTSTKCDFWLTREGVPRPVVPYVAKWGLYDNAVKSLLQNKDSYVQMNQWLLGEGKAAKELPNARHMDVLEAVAPVWACVSTASKILEGTKATGMKASGVLQVVQKTLKKFIAENGPKEDEAGAAADTEAAPPAPPAPAPRRRAAVQRPAREVAAEHAQTILQNMDARIVKERFKLYGLLGLLHPVVCRMDIPYLQGEDLSAYERASAPPPRRRAAAITLAAGAAEATRAAAMLDFKVAQASQFVDLFRVEAPGRPGEVVSAPTGGQDALDFLVSPSAAAASGEEGWKVDLRRFLSDDHRTSLDPFLPRRPSKHKSEPRTSFDYINIDLFGWWRAQRHHYPNLCAAVQVALGVLASEAAAESVFSEWKAMTPEQRNRLGVDKVLKLMRAKAVARAATDVDDVLEQFRELDD